MKDSAPDICLISQFASRKVLSLAIAVVLSCSFAAVAFSSPSFAAIATTPSGTDQVRLMTRNLYQGADLSPVFAATTPTQFIIEVGAAYGRMQATNFPERADSIASDIQEGRPDLVGLQEAVLIRTQVPSDGPATPATYVAYDFIQILLDKLAARGLHYHTAAVQTGSDVEVPGLLATGLMDVRLTDRDAILVRDDVSGFALSTAQGGQFTAKLPISTPFGALSIPRSWVSVDVTFNDGNKIRILSTHLDPISPVIQSLQGAELLSGPGNTALPLVFLGDFNSNADGTGTSTYGDLIAAGMKDAWTILGEGSGFTCCQDASLLNPNSNLSRRIDLVLFHGNFKVQDIELVGNTQDDRTTSGLWPSDHAGIVAKLKLNTSG